MCFRDDCNIGVNNMERVNVYNWNWIAGCCCSFWKYGAWFPKSKYYILNIFILIQSGPWPWLKASEMGDWLRTAAPPRNTRTIKSVNRREWEVLWFRKCVLYLSHELAFIGGELGFFRVSLYRRIRVFQIQTLIGQHDHTALIVSPDLLGCASRVCPWHSL